MKHVEVSDILSEIPIDLDKIDQKDLDKEILRKSIIAELDAIDLYEQMAHMTNDKNIKKVLLDVAKEEKEHVGEFQEMLVRRDKELVEEMNEGREEVREMTGE